jgi:predicted N-acetyltransferase YhbS
VSPATGLRLERLDAHHDLSHFDSSNDELDAWLRRHALAAQQMDSARTFVVTKARRVVGYFSLTMGSVLRQDAPSKLVRGLPAYPVGMVLLARLAVDRVEQGTGLGATLLAEALRKAVSAGDAAAARLVVVDAVDENAARFYERFGFVPAPGHPFRLYRRMKDVRASLAAERGVGTGESPDG